MKTLQETYNQIRDHLLTQNARAGHSDSCRYKTVDGLRCAVGCLIEPEHYNPAMEGAALTFVQTVGGKWHTDQGRSRTVLCEALNASGIPATPEHRRLLIHAQEIHDERPVEEWREAMKDLAEDLKLEP